jgi:cytochrome c
LYIPNIKKINMKKLFIPVLALSALIACNSGGSKEETKEVPQEEKKDTVAEVVDITKNPDYQKGLSLLAQNDCLTCHKVDETLTGPAYRDVANKYAGADTAVAYLSKKVIEGGSGVWGQVMMTPHPTISQADAEAMVKYILLLKSK